MAIIAMWIRVTIICLFGMTFVLDVVLISTGSMQDTLIPGDHLLVDKLAYAPSAGFAHRFLPYRDLESGNIIMFRSPIDKSQLYIKRIVGVPGDRIKMVGRVLYRNERRVIEPYTQAIFPSDPLRDNFPLELSRSSAHGSEGRPLYDKFRNYVTDGEILIPPNSYFVLGDNRDDSNDSRYWGFVPRNYIVGQPTIIYWSPRSERIFHVFR